MTHKICETDGCTQWVFGYDPRCGRCTKHNHIVHVLGDLLVKDMDEDFMLDEFAQMLTVEKVRLVDSEIRSLCTIYHESHGNNADSLEASNRLFVSIHHINEMVIDSYGTGLEYV